MILSATSLGISKLESDEVMNEFELYVLAETGSLCPLENLSLMTASLH